MFADLRVFGHGALYPTTSLPLHSSAQHSIKSQYSIKSIKCCEYLVLIEIC